MTNLTQDFNPPDAGREWISNTVEVEPPKPGLYFGGDAEYASMLKAIGVFEVVEGFVEHEVWLVCDPGQPRLQAQVQRIQSLIERLEVALIARRIVRVGSAQVGGHFCSDHSGISR